MMLASVQYHWDAQSGPTVHYVYADDPEHMPEDRRRAYELYLADLEAARIAPAPAVRRPLWRRLVSKKEKD